MPKKEASREQALVSSNNWKKKEKSKKKAKKKAEAAISILHFQGAVHHALINLDNYKLPSWKAVLCLGLP